MDDLEEKALKVVAFGQCSTIEDTTRKRGEIESHKRVGATRIATDRQEFGILNTGENNVGNVAKVAY